MRVWEGGVPEECMETLSLFSHALSYASLPSGGSLVVVVVVV